MKFDFAGRHLPLSIRLARSFLFAQASLLLIVALFVVIAATLLGSGTAVNGGQPDSPNAVGLVLALTVAGLVVCAVGWDLGRVSSQSRVTTVTLEVVMAIFFAAHSSGEVTSLVVWVGLCGVIVALLFTSSSRAAFQASSARPAASAPGESQDSPAAGGEPDPEVPAEEAHPAGTDPRQG